jgi:hypothetical protein
MFFTRRPALWTAWSLPIPDSCCARNIAQLVNGSLIATANNGTLMIRNGIYAPWVLLDAPGDLGFQARSIIVPGAGGWPISWLLQQEQDFSKSQLQCMPALSDPRLSI